MSHRRSISRRLYFNAGSASRARFLTALRPIFLWLFLFLILSLGGCATRLGAPARIAPLQGQPVVAIPDFDFHALSPEMEVFLQRYVLQEKKSDQRAANLARATTDPKVLGFRYDPGLTLDSVETFNRRAGNCLAFSSMLVAMARHAGLTAWYQEVEIPPEWTSLNNTVLVSLHVNVVLEGRQDEWVIDVSGRSGEPSRRIRRIPDSEALAQYYNNLGANALTQSNLALAYAYFTKAIATEPRLSYVWSNLGVVYSRNDQQEEARATYRAALAMDPQQLIAANNLFLMYEREGNREAAEKLQARVERHRRKNPYYLYHLSELALEEGRYEESSAMLNQAIDLYAGEYRFHYHLARLSMLQGYLEQAKWSLGIARALAPDNSLVRSADIDHLPELAD